MEFEPRDQFEQRLKKLREIEAPVSAGGLEQRAYPNRFDWTNTARDLATKYGDTPADQLPGEEVRVAGRIVALRPHGKAGFAHIWGDGGKLQIYAKLDIVGERGFKLYQLLDLGDIVGVAGHLFRTKTNELTVRVERLELLTKALLPLPEKWHGLADVELRYRRRYLDLIANEHARDIFVKRAQIIAETRKFFDACGYIEVETPMMHGIPGGAVARPFVTHHNALDMDLYLRIAPELYLKRLVAGGLDRVYEINRNFRNEGIDAIHQPEFTMLEFYQAYSAFGDLMDLTEELLRGLAQRALGTTKFRYGDTEVDLGRFERLSMRGAIRKFWPAAAGAAPEAAELTTPGGARKVAEGYNGFARSRGLDLIEPGKSDGETIGDLFEAVAEERLVQPTFIYDFPAEISPLAKTRADDPSTAERFELFIAGMEIANGFSELNDPAEQERRFREQVAAASPEMPKEVDSDYIRALCHGLPPTAGEGIGIDRLAMLFTDSRTIREVILFPLLRREPKEEGASGEVPAGEAPGPSRK